jgi:hypothetical protein
VNVKVLTDKLTDVSPMHFLHIGVSKCHHNRHGLLELLDQESELVLDSVVLEGTFKTLANLGVLLRDLLNVGSVNLTELGLHPVGLHRVPVGERVPHKVTVGQLGAELVQVVEISLGNVKLGLPVIVALRSLIVLLEILHLGVEGGKDFWNLVSLHVGLVKELGLDSLSVEVVDASVQLRDQPSKCLLKFLGLTFLLLLEARDNLI